MSNKSVISEGNTTKEAIENGLKILKVSENQVNVKVLETEKKSFFSILAPRIVKVELTLKDNNVCSENSTKNNSNSDKKIIKEYKEISKEKLDIAEKNVKVFLDSFVNKVGKNVEYNISKKADGIEIFLKGEEVSFLIGYRGENLYAFQTIISSVANKSIDEKIRVWLDIEGYKEKREKTLQELAIKLSKTVERTGKPVTLEPMQAYERKIIHSTLQNSNTVKTESIGEEPRRRVIIGLK